MTALPCRDRIGVAEPQVSFCGPMITSDPVVDLTRQSSCLEKDDLARTPEEPHSISSPPLVELNLLPMQYYLKTGWHPSCKGTLDSAKERIHFPNEP